MTADERLRVVRIPGGYMAVEAEPNPPVPPVSVGPSLVLSPAEVRARREKAAAVRRLRRMA